MKSDLKFGLLLTKLVRYQEHLESNTFYLWTQVLIHTFFKLQFPFCVTAWKWGTNVHVLSELIL